MSYQVLARKYRPQKFSDVIGQEHVTQTLKNAIAQERIAHGYIFSGHRGIGKTTVARILAMSLNCRSAAKPVPEPCGVCDSCTEIRAGNAVDVIEIDAASNTGVDNIRELIERALTTNNNLAAATIKVKRAQLSAKLTDTNLTPTVAASVSSSLNRDLNSRRETKTSGVTATASYELDLWGKLASARDAGTWEAEATAYDRQSTALALVGTVASLFISSRLKGGRGRG